MYYRPCVWRHTLRLTAMVRRVVPIAEEIFFLHQTPFDGQKALAITPFHDDPEIDTDDIAIIVKDCMTKAEKDNHDRRTEIAIEELSWKLPATFKGFSYKKLLQHAHRKDCLEAQVVKWLDWLDAICEITHELLAGNLMFYRAIVRSSAGVSTIKSDYAALLPLFDRGKECPFLNAAFDRHHLPYVDESLYSHLGQPHTRQSIQLPTDIPLYDAWKRLVMEDFGEEGMDWLTKQVEFFPMAQGGPPRLALVS